MYYKENGQLDRTYMKFNLSKKQKNKTEIKLENCVEFCKNEDKLWKEKIKQVRMKRKLSLMRRTLDEQQT